MAEITTAMVKSLRDETGAGVMDVKRALEDSEGNLDKAREALRDRGLAAAAKRSEREARQGVVDSYIHSGRIGVLVEVNCETDFVAATDAFKELARNIAMQVAAMNPAVVSAEDREGKDLSGEDSEIVLLAQPFIRDGSKTIQDLVNDAIARTGENIRVSRFVRFELGQ